MAIVNRSTNSKNKFKRKSKKDLIPVRVLDIILDENHPNFKEYGGYDSIGTIIYSKIEKNITKEYIENPNIARPLFSYLKYYPLINEIVLILTTTDKSIYNSGFDTTYYMPTINVWNHPHHNALPNLNDLRINDGDQQADYEEVESGIVRRPKDGGTDIELGKYFNEQNKLKPLLPFEGDTIIEGRFGNSIRFGSTTKERLNNWSFSDPEYIGSPITIIRNGQTRNVNSESWKHIIEDINTDASSIYMTSDQSISNFKTSGITTANELTISWPSFGQPQPDVIINTEITEVNIEDITEEEIQEIIQGEDEITNLNEQVEDITIIEQIPETEEEENSSEITKYVNSVFGKFTKLPLSAGTDRIFAVKSTEDLLQQADGEFRKVYYPIKTNISPSSEITSKKLIEIMSYYKIKPSPGKPAFYTGFSKTAINANLADEYFRAHYLPVANSIHIPSYQGYMNLYKDALANEYLTEEELDYRIRVQILDDIWAEVAHAADIDLNGVGGYLKDDIGGAVGDWFKKLFTGEVRRKNKNQPDATFIPESYDNLNPEEKTFSVRISDTPATPSNESITVEEGDINVILDFINIPEGNGNKTQTVMTPNTGKDMGITKIFKSDSFLNETNIKYIKEYAEKFLKEYFNLEIILRYIDLSLIGDGSYDNVAHYEGRTHNLVEPQLEALWLTDYSADNDLAQENDLEVISESKPEAEAKYEELASIKGISTPPKKYYNQATGEYIIKDKEIPLPEKDTIDGEGRSIDQATAQKKARRDAEQKANQLGARVGGLVKATPSKLGDQYIYRATYILIKPE